ncbi:MAG: ImmA/IrrE family metallo-endopeptidase [Mucilaginibacter sp.]|nr:ImmA/IrrE family metallo-endopeptidase [Mucilaginibacter sp.]
MSEQPVYTIQPDILHFMRKSSGMSEDEIADKLKLSKARYLKIENGNEKISQKDLVHLADIYKRPLIAFYSIDPTQTTELPHDYRLNRDKKISPEVFLAKRKALYLAEELKEITGRKTTIPQINTNTSAIELAEQVRKLLNVDFNILKEIVERKEETALSYYKSLIEEQFFIPVLEHPLKSSGVRAFSVFSDVCVMVLNESDSNEVRLLSLFHEFCHLLKRQDGICAVDIEKDIDNQPEEKYCDEFAAFLLVPEDQLQKEVNGSQIKTMKQLNDVSSLFGVSKLVAIIQMKNLGVIDSLQFKFFKGKLEAVKKSAFGRRNWEQTYVKRTSRLVLNNLIESFKKGDLTYTALLTITGIKDKYLQKFI